MKKKRRDFRGGIRKKNIKENMRTKENS